MSALAGGAPAAVALPAAADGGSRAGWDAGS